MTEQTEAADWLATEQAANVLGAKSQREYVESMAAANLGLVGLYAARAHVRKILAGCAVVGTWLALAWSIWAMIRWA